MEERLRGRRGPTHRGARKQGRNGSSRFLIIVIPRRRSQRGVVFDEYSGGQMTYE